MQVCDSIVAQGMSALVVKDRQFLDAINEAIKGKSSLVKMQESVSETVERTNARIEANHEIFIAAQKEHGDAVAYGMSAFLVMTNEAAKVEIERRIERHRAAIKEAELKAEAEKLRKEAEAAKVAEPTPAPVTSQPVAVVAPSPAKVPQGETQHQERERFKDAMQAAFRPIKEARAALKHESNIKDAIALDDALSAAWLEFLGKEAK